MFKKKKLPTVKNLHCLNCEFPFTGHEVYCPNCGQKNTTGKVTFGNFIREVFAGFFSWDAKFWRTLFPLLTKPGKVSRDYAEGKRARYTNPFRFYLTASVIFFLIVSAKKTHRNYKELVNPENQKTSVEVLQEKARKDSIQQAVIKDLDSISQKVGTITTSTKDSTNTKELIRDLNISFKDTDQLIDFLEFQKNHETFSTDEALDSLGSEKTFWNRFWYSKTKTVNKLISDKDENERLKQHLSSYFPITILLILPILALFLKLLYIRRNFSYIEHLIFSFNIQTVTFILASFLLLISFFTNVKSGTILSISIGIMLIYLYIAMFNFYRQKWFKTLMKFLLINLIFFIVFAGAFSLMSLISFMSY